MLLLLFLRSFSATIRCMKGEGEGGGGGEGEGDSGGGWADVGSGPDDDAACPPEAEAAGVDLNLSSEALITRPRAQPGIFSASSQMSKKTASATAEMWGASGPYSP